MTNRRGAARLGALLLLAALAGCRDAGEPAPDPADDGPTTATLEELEAMESRARGLLETDRPWQAARLMERYLALADPAGPSARLLAARAAAARDDWAAVDSLLPPASALEGAPDGVGFYLLARARDEAGDAEAAAEAYRRFLALSPAASGMGDVRSAARLRLGLALLRTGDGPEARAALDRAREDLGDSEPWLAVLEAGARARVGDTTGVREAGERARGRILELWTWRARVEAARKAGDAAQARRLANEARRWARTDGTDAEFLLAAARPALAMGDTAPARAALIAAVDLAPASPYARDAADLLREPGMTTPAARLAIARVHVARGEHADALPHFRAWLDAGEGSASERREVGLEHATALFYAGRQAEVEEALRPLGDADRVRRLRARTLAHLDDPAGAAAIYLDMARGGGTLDLFLAADTWHDAGAFDRAGDLYRRVIEGAPGSDRAGLSMMRLAGMAFEAGDHDAAAAVWGRYVDRYPGGARILQATYWLGRAREAMGDTAAARARYREVRRAERDSYYALLAGRRLGEPFWPLPTGDSPPADPGAAERVADWMSGLDVLREAGFPEAADEEARWLTANAGRDRAVRFALAEALAERGYGRSAILLGSGLRTSAPASLRLLRILYPFSYRPLVSGSASDRGLDPFVAAALIRQESMYEARITSYAGARGLMQLMPETGQELARTAGLERWDPDMLYRPEINVYLGTMLLARHVEAYDGFLPAVFSAYNAGPHRVERWRAFPSYGDAELFTERIPYTETRDYVKILTRNLAIYEGLYGAPGPDPG